MCLNAGLLKNVESGKVHVAALVVGTVTGDDYSHWAAVQSLSAWLEKAGIPGITGVDTRAITKHLRSTGCMLGKVMVGGADPSSVEWDDVNARNMVAEVSIPKPMSYNPNGDVDILVVDCGLRHSQLRCLAERGAKLRVVPWNHNLENEQFDGLFLSSGPGDPDVLTGTVEQIKKVLDRDDGKPIFGICLGHQMMAKAAGANTYKLKYGNRGHNQPCTYANSNRCYITSQNHGFAVDPAGLNAGWTPLWTNENDKTNEGIVHDTKPYFSAQFHPEASAGPEDMFVMFDVFMDLAKKKTTKSAAEYLKDTVGKEDPTFKADELGGGVIMPKKVLILGSGALSIGQAGEFDYSGSQAIKALKEEGISTVLINPNIATVQTDPGLADKVYFLPVTPGFVEDVIKAERPDGVLLSFGGQTALNCGIALEEAGTFAKHGVQVLGTPVSAIQATEDRDIFEQKLKEIGEKSAPSGIAEDVEECIKVAEEIGYPVLARAAFALGGLGSGFAHNRKELVELCTAAFHHTTQVIIDKSLRGFKEIEYEVVRDIYDNCITVCNMENVDPLGVHTGESIVVAPSQTLSNREYQMLRNTGIKVIRHLGIVGECNIQYALDPDTEEYFIIEVNARLSRSSALASKATGYPLAFVAAKLLLGQPLPKLRNSVTGSTTTDFEPSLDYLVVKMPRWDLSKFPRVSKEIGSAMKSTGEVMAIGRRFEEALQKSMRMMDGPHKGFEDHEETAQWELTDESLATPTDHRIYLVAKALAKGYSVERVFQLTRIDRWFLSKMKVITDHTNHMAALLGPISKDDLRFAKQLGHCDSQIAQCLSLTSLAVRQLRESQGITPVVKLIDTVAGEFPAVTNYLYLTYNGTEHDVEFDGGAVMTLGSGVYRIGSSVEFDWCGVRCVRALRNMGYKTIVVNYNPETVSTDYDETDRLYFDELSFETVFDIYQLENPLGVIMCMGGQIPNNIATRLDKTGKVNILGTSADSIDNAENRFKFSRMLDNIGIEQPAWRELTDIDSAKDFCNGAGYPCIVRPSYVLSGAAMNVAYTEDDLTEYLREATTLGPDHPVVVSKMILGAKEVDVDAVACEGETLSILVMEHIENAGVHSGDATMVTPPQDLTAKTIAGIHEITRAIGKALNVSGPFNIQFIAKDDTLKVIECNLRVSRSLPFSSKTWKVDMIGLATMVAMGHPVEPIEIKPIPYVGMKVSQFSFSRLPGADPTQGVDMHSTGEVACFGENMYTAYMKAMLATGFTIPKKTVVLSIGTFKGKQEFLGSVRALFDMGFKVYASAGTADFYRENGLHVPSVEWPYSELSGQPHASPAKGDKPKDTTEMSMRELLESGKVDLVINLPMRNKSHSPAAFVTQGYLTRRAAIDYGIPLITDIKCGKLFVESLRQCGLRALPDDATEDLRKIPINTVIDSVSAHRVIQLPGLIDTHCHLREPGGEHKEDWDSGTAAALAGGFTMVCAMPNTNPAVVDMASFQQAQALAEAKARCDYAIFVGASPHNSAALPEIGAAAAGLMMYLSQSFTSPGLESMTQWREHFENWPKELPIAVHAESHSAGAVILTAALCDRSVHICHIARREEIELVRDAKQRGLKVTCEVAPHHLFLNDEDGAKLGNKGSIVPPLCSKDDQQALWDNLDVIDCFASAHAPHTLQEKEGDDPAPGFPSLETCLPLLLTAISQGRLTVAQLTEKLYTNPRAIFGLPEQQDTYVEVDLDQRWVVPESTEESRCGWTPFAGMEMVGMVRRVVLRGNIVYLDGKVTAEKGFGQDVRKTSKFEGLATSGSDTANKGLTANAVKASEALPPRSLLSSKSPQIGGAMAPRSPSRRRTPPSMKSDDTGDYHSMPPPLELETLTITMRLPFKHLTSVKQFDKGLLYRLFQVATQMRSMVQSGRPINLLQGKVMASVFYEASTRTSCSFIAAMERLGGSVIALHDMGNTSVKKGESLSDTIRTMEAMCDLTILRHPGKGAVQEAAKVGRKPIISGGDGTGEHPSQALLDVFTIREELGTLNGITITMVGDLKHGRTVHSLAQLASLYDIKLVYVSPAELKMPDEVKEAVKQVGVEQTEYTELTEDIIRKTVRSSLCISISVRLLSHSLAGRSERARALGRKRNTYLRRGFECTDRQLAFGWAVWHGVQSGVVKQLTTCKNIIGPTARINTALCSRALGGTLPQLEPVLTCRVRLISILRTSCT